jgi:hypothetical protein
MREIVPTRPPCSRSSILLEFSQRRRRRRRRQRIDGDLVIMLDPNSTQSPEPILDMWRGGGGGRGLSRPPLMNITVWTDRDIHFRHYAKYPERSFVKRQVTFNRACAEFLKGRGRTWTSFHDVDEYVKINDNGGPMMMRMMLKSDETDNHLERLSRQPGFVLKLIREDDDDSRLVQQRSKNPDASCIPVPRRGFGANEEGSAVVAVAALTVSQQERHDDHDDHGIVVVPAYLNTTNFETLRFRHRAKGSSNGVNGLPKCLFDVQHIPNKNNNNNNNNNNKNDATNNNNDTTIHNKTNNNNNNESWGGVHYIVKPACLAENSLWGGNNNVLVINHYRGSLESYLSRVDGRRSIDAFMEYQAKANDVQDDQIRPWIRNFVDYVGEPLAKHLLKDAGQMEW